MFHPPCESRAFLLLTFIRFSVIVFPLNLSTKHHTTMKTVFFAFVLMCLCVEDTVAQRSSSCNPLSTCEMSIQYNAMQASVNNTDDFIRAAYGYLDAFSNLITVLETGDAECDCAPELMRSIARTQKEINQRIPNLRRGGVSVAQEVSRLVEDQISYLNEAITCW